MAPKREVQLQLGEQSSHEEAMEWLRGVLKGSEHAQVVRVFKQQKYAPDGGILLSCSMEDLHNGLGIPTAIAHKIYPALQAAKNSAATPNGRRQPVVVKQEYSDDVEIVNVLEAPATRRQQQLQQAERVDSDIEIVSVSMPTRATRRRSRSEAALGEAAMPLPSPAEAGAEGAAAAAGAPGSGAAAGAAARPRRVAVKEEPGEAAEEQEQEQQQQQEQPEEDEGEAEGGPRRSKRARQLRMSSAAATASGGGRSASRRRSAKQGAATESGSPAGAAAAGAAAGAAARDQEAEAPVAVKHEAGLPDGEDEDMEEEDAGAAAAAAGGVARRTRAARRQQEAAEAAAERRGGRGAAAAGAGGGRRGRAQAESRIEFDTALSCWRGLEDIFRLMSVEKLKELGDNDEYDFHEDCLRKKNREGDLVDLPKAQMVVRMAKYMMYSTLDNTDDEAGGGWSLDEIELFLKRHCDEEVKQYVRDKLTYEFADIPQGIRDEHTLMWKLWERPVGLPLPNQVLLGEWTFQLEGTVNERSGLDKHRRDDLQAIGFKHVYEAIDLGYINVVQEEDTSALLAALDFLSDQPRISVRAKVNQNHLRNIKVWAYLKPPAGKSTHVINACWEGKDKEGGDAVFDMDLMMLFCTMDHLRGREEYENQLIELGDAFETARQQTMDEGLDDVLPVKIGLGLKQFDTVMSLVEDKDHPEPEDLEERCHQAIALDLRPYQRRSIAFMLDKELREGGMAAGLWVKVPLPKNPRLHCYVSPILHQIRISTSKIEMEQSIGAVGGAGWLALEMGMGKTACAVGAMLLNPPPANWREERMWQEPTEDDYLAAAVNNMPRGGTLVVGPPTLLMQWEQEIRKTARGANGESGMESEGEEGEEQPALSVLDWGDRAGKRDPRIEDCRQVAEYDVVITTPALAATKHTLSNIYWHRIIVDEPQLAMGGFLSDKGHLWMATNRWTMTGTPINAAVETISPSLQFLRMGGFTDAFKYLPAVMAHTLQSSMVRYTKAGSINGVRNLELPEVTERVLECELDDEDDKYYDDEEVAARVKLNKALASKHLDLEYGRNEPDYQWKKSELKMGPIRKLIEPLRKSAGGAFKHKTGEYEEADDGRWVEIKYLTTSKADALIEDLRQLKEEDPESKVLIFSEWPDALRQVQRRLPSIGLQHRAILGGSNSQVRGRAIKLFQTDPPTKVFLLTHRAGGAGVTLTAATHVYLLEPVLNASFEKQAIGRTVRMGQTCPVTVTRVVMKGTIEERLVSLLARLREHPGAGDGEEGEEQFHSTAAEVNPVLNDQTSKLEVEDIYDLLNNTAPAAAVGDNYGGSDSE